VSSLRKAPSDNDIIELSETNFAALNGKYSDELVSKNNPSNGDLYWYIFDQGYNFKDSINYVELILLSPKRLHVRIFDGETLRKDRVFKGKIKNGYFVFRKRYLFIPALYMNVYRDRKLRIGK